MRVKYNLRDIISLYESCIKIAYKYYNQKDYVKTIDCIRCAAYIQYQINYLFSDRKLDDLICSISKELVGEKPILSLDNNCVVFYDAFGIDNKGLTQQYLDALINIGNLSIVYIHENNLGSDSSGIKQLLTSNNASIIELGNAQEISKISRICDIIDHYKPSNIVCHISPSTSIPFLIALNAYPRIIKFNINLTDHAFWLGSAKLFDYNLEFRPFGASISYFKRGFDKKQILYSPYYPWRDNCKFDGFPDKCKGKVIIFSGGNLYKIEGANDLFLNLVRKIVEKDENVVFVFAGWGDTSYFANFVKKYNLQEKFFFIGNRKDIDQVFKNIDIYIGTYPIGGGLMNMLAAINGKPILIYKNLYAASEMLPVGDKVNFVFETEEDLITEARRMIKDETYRKNIGILFQESIMNQEKFRNHFKDLFLKHKTIDHINELTIDESYCSSFLNIINDNQNLSIELPVLKATHRVLIIKVLINLMLNLNKVIRLCGKELFI